MTRTVNEIITGEIAPLLEVGKNGKGCFLSAHNCKSLLFVLRTSVPIEPFTALFSKFLTASRAIFINKTILPPFTADGDVDHVDAGDGESSRADSRADIDDVIERWEK